MSSRKRLAVAGLLLATVFSIAACSRRSVESEAISGSAAPEPSESVSQTHEPEEEVRGPETADASAPVPTAEPVASDEVLTEETQLESEPDTPSPQEPEKDDTEEQRRAAVRSALASLPYYGDPERCVMSAEQAAAYAQLLNDGLTGNYTGVFSDNYAEVAYWVYPDIAEYRKRLDEGDSYSGNEAYDYFSSYDYIQRMSNWEVGAMARGYNGDYHTDRALACLCDLAGDGNPYLVLLSSGDDEGFTIFGWNHGRAEQVYSGQAYVGRATITLTVFEDGMGKASSGGSNGAANHSSNSYGFSGGAMEEIYYQDEHMDYTTSAGGTTLTGTIRVRGFETSYQHDMSNDTYYVMENGVRMEYTREQFFSLPYIAYDGASHGETAFTSQRWSPNDPVPQTVFLHDMVELLNQYVEASGGDTAQAAPQKSSVGRFSLS